MCVNVFYSRSQRRLQHAPEMAVVLDEELDEIKLVLVALRETVSNINIRAHVKK